MDAVLHRVAELAQATLGDSAAASVTLIQDGRAATAAQTDPVALVLDEAQYDAADGPCLEAAAQDTVLVADDLATEQRWPAFTAAARGCGIRSTLAAGIVREGAVAAALNVYAVEPAAFGREQIAAAELFASYAAVTLSNAAQLSESRRLADQLSEAMASRAVIEQAKGILVAQRGVSPEEAFRMLASASQSSNRKLRDIAQSMVDGAAGEGARRDV